MLANDKVLLKYILLDVFPSHYTEFKHLLILEKKISNKIILNIMVIENWSGRKFSFNSRESKNCLPGLKIQINYTYILGLLDFCRKQ